MITDPISDRVSSYLAWESSTTNVETLSAIFPAEVLFPRARGGLDFLRASLTSSAVVQIAGVWVPDLPGEGLLEEVDVHIVPVRKSHTNLLKRRGADT